MLHVAYGTGVALLDMFGYVAPKPLTLSKPLLCVFVKCKQFIKEQAYVSICVYFFSCVWKEFLSCEKYTVRNTGLIALNNLTI